MARCTINGHSLAGDKVRGKHTTFLEIDRVKNFLRRAVNDDEVIGLLLGRIVPTKGTPRSKERTKETPVGLVVTVFSVSSKQEIILWTKSPRETAGRLGLQLN